MTYNEFTHSHLETDITGLFYICEPMTRKLNKNMTKQIDHICAYFITPRLAIFIEELKDDKFQIINDIGNTEWSWSTPVMVFTGSKTTLKELYSKFKNQIKE